MAGGMKVKVDEDTWALVGGWGPQGVKGDTGAKGDTGSQGVKGDQGDQGIQGIQGVKGDTGTPGEKWFTQAGAPAGATGVIGDWALDSTNGDYYEKTGASAWTLRGNLKGPQGIQGTQGIQGLTGQAEAWHSGASAPAGALGAVGDWYLNTTTGQVSEKTGASTWTDRANITGPQGIQGIQGIQGTPGPSLWVGTQAQFDALGTYSPTTFYHVTP